MITAVLLFSGLLVSALRAATCPEAPKTEHFAAEKLESLRAQAAKLSAVNGELPEGWSKSRINPGDLVSLFKPLTVRDGVVLRAYQFHQDGSGNAVVWALPADAEFPAPDACPQGRFLPDLDLAVPRPPAAFASTMAQIRGDHSPWSYLVASLLTRELRELGALWHGSKWSTHEIVDEDPLQELNCSPGTGVPDLRKPRGPRNEWEWCESGSIDWKPRVILADDQVTVVFYSYSGWERQRIYRHTDRYRRGSYECESEQTIVATGPGGYLF